MTDKGTATYCWRSRATIWFLLSSRWILRLPLPHLGILDQFHLLIVLMMTSGLCLIGDQGINMGTVGLAQVSRIGFQWDIAMDYLCSRVHSRTREAAYPAQSHTCASQIRGNKIPGPHGLWNMSMGRIDTCLDVFASLLVVILWEPRSWVLWVN